MKWVLSVVHIVLLIGETFEVTVTLKIFSEVVLLSHRSNHGLCLACSAVASHASVCPGTAATFFWSSALLARTSLACPPAACSWGRRTSGLLRCPRVAEENSIPRARLQKEEESEASEEKKEAPPLFIFLMEMTAPPRGGRWGEGDRGGRWRSGRRRDRRWSGWWLRWRSLGFKFLGL